MRLLLALAALPAALSLTLQVDSTEDIPGSCPSSSQYVCTYRAALQAAIDSQVPESELITILLPAARFGIYWKELPHLYVRFGRQTKTIVIKGAPMPEPGSGEPANGTVLDGTGKYQLLRTNTGINVSMSDITFVNGAARGGSHDGGALVNDGNMYLTNVFFENCTALAGGGAVSSSGNLTIRTGTFINNSAEDGGAISSSGSAGHRSSLVATDLLFEHNVASQTAGAVLNAQGTFHLVNGHFRNHSAAGLGGVGGTLFNGDRAFMSITDVDIEDSNAGSGGILANGETTAVFEAVRVNFINAIATAYAGGHVQNKGAAHFLDCTFRESMAHNAQKYAQGSTLALTAINATATLVNCTIDADRTRRYGGDDMPSELFVGPAGAVLNLTFVNITSCHKGTLLLEDPGQPGHADKKLILRGSSVCADGTLETNTVDAATRAMIAGCDEPEEAPWQCGRRAVCTPHPIELGVTCECPSGSPLPEAMWGFPYGGDDAVIPGSHGFDGCFEQWDASLDTLDATGCTVLPNITNATRSDYACCALRAADHTSPVRTVVNATADGEDHTSHPVFTPPTGSVSVNNVVQNANVSVNVTSFDGNHTRSYSVHVHWQDGDVLCTPGERTTCYNATGGAEMCVSKTYYPVDLMEGYALCVGGDSPLAPQCGYTTFGAECHCPTCVASKEYACMCKAPQTAGTATCAADGMSISACDCDTPYAYYPSPPPPFSPPPNAPGSAHGVNPAVYGAAAGVVALIGVVGGGYYYMRRSSASRRRFQRAEMNAALLNDNQARATTAGAPVNPGGTVNSGTAPPAVTQQAPTPQQAQ